MYMIVFCLLAVVSGWSAWRRNPLFSARATLRFMVAVGSMLAVVIWAIYLAANYSGHVSEARGLTVMFTSVFFATAAMIWVTIVVSTPKSAALPASAKVLNVYRKKVMVWAKRLVYSLLVLGALALVVPRDGRVIFGMLAGMLAFLGILCVFALYLSCRQLDRWLSAVEAQPWVHWTYTPEQWKQWTAVEVARTPATPTFQWRTGWKKVVLYIGGTCVLIMLVDPGPWTYRALCCVGLCALMATLAWVGRRSEKNAPRRVQATLVKAPLEVYFGAEGLFVDGAFIPWMSTGNFLLQASLDERAPRSLHLQFEKIVPSNTGNGTILVNQYVLLPDGQDVASDLLRLQREISAKCPTASVSLA